ncbi:MAG: selenocysteine-specific translation elongation factor [Candidatus Aegiribacteria sp.]|nr:selenocysteine-specific translation elongation factor [Candidatus Aegiribacteria sp.]
MGVIVGTAGHIDHGKSQLVKYLTGSDPDRLKEEKERGITIELGYVFMPTPDGGLISFIDVPGHESFIRQMVAGTATVDCFLLVVAADEGIMPQTREHLDILRLLGVENGIVALTKCDLVDDEMQELVESEIEEYFEDSVFSGTPVYRVSSMTGTGMEEIRKAIISLAEETGQRQTGDRFRLDIDRVFVLEGFGTIIAGTAISGIVSIGDELELQPGCGKYRVRSMSVNANKGVKTGVAGDRIALNLVGLHKDDVQRGSCVAEPGYLRVKGSLDTTLTLLETAKPLKKYQRVRLHTGTAEVMARAVPVEADFISPGTAGYVHFQLETPVVALPGDKYVVRNYSPVITIGGGRILEAGTRKVRKKYAPERTTHLIALESGDIESLLEEKLEHSGIEGITLKDAEKSTSLAADDILNTLLEMEKKGRVELVNEGSAHHAVRKIQFDKACERLVSGFVRHHEKNPVSPGLQLTEPFRILKEYPRWFSKAVVNRLVESGELERREAWLALTSHHREIPSVHSEAVDGVIARVETGENMGLSLADCQNSALVKALVERGMLYELTGDVLVTSERAEALIGKVKERFGESGFSLGELRDFLDVSRKVALKWADFFDSRGWTIRKGDKRFCKQF